MFCFSVVLYTNVDFITNESIKAQVLCYTKRYNVIITVHIAFLWVIYIRSFIDVVFLSLCNIASAI